MSEERDPEALGWNAIDEALSGVYGDVEPKHWGTIVPYFIGGKDPLTGLSAFRDTDDGTSWHFVTYGFSELYEKEWDDPEVSGFGFELTFRLLADDIDEHAPWVFSLLQNLARYVFETGRRFGEGHTMPLNGPICAESDTKIVGIALVLDPQLGEIATPNGSVKFLQVVGLTEDELAAVQHWNARSFLDLAASTNSKLVTDIERNSLLDEPQFAEQVATRTAEEGASCGEFYANRFTFKKSQWTRICTVTLGAFLVDDLTRRICGRIPFGREFVMASDLAAIIFIASNEDSWAIEDETLRIEITPDTAIALRETLQPKVGEYEVPGLDRLVFEVERTEIKDSEGNVTKVVG